MTLYKLAFRNIKRSVKDYTVYFFTLALAVAVFYVFNAIDSQTAMINISQSAYEVVKLMLTVMSAVGVLVAFILGFLLIYASRFLIRKRSKEFALYLILGMTRRKVASILFFETLIIGIVSLGVGLLTGVVFAQFSSVLIVHMFRADMTSFKFTFSPGAALWTVVCFGVIYLVIMLFNTFYVSRYKLIDLLTADKKNENIKAKNSFVCTLLFCAAVAVLYKAYMMVTRDIIDTLQLGPNGILIPIAMGCIGTFLVFYRVSGLAGFIITKFKGFYHKGLNSFVFRQFAGKINTTVFSMTMICLMLFVTICAFASGLSIRNSLNAGIDKFCPRDIEFVCTVNMDESYIGGGYGYTRQQVAGSKTLPKQRMEYYGFAVDDYIKDYVEYSIYKFNDLTMRDYFGSEYEKLHRQFPFVKYEKAESVISLSDYNKIAHLYGIEEQTLGYDEYLVIANYMDMIRMRDVSLAAGVDINVNGHLLKPRYSRCQYGFVELSDTESEAGIIVVPNWVVDAVQPEYAGFVGNFIDRSPANARKVDGIINRIWEENYKDGPFTVPMYTSKSILEDQGIGVGAMTVFIGLYIGLVFLITSGALLALKELSESSDNRIKFNTLRRIGVSENMLKKALFSEIFIFFAFPLTLAIIHSIYGMKFSNYVLNAVIRADIPFAVMVTAIFLAVIYGGYLLITYLCARNIVIDRN